MGTFQARIAIWKCWFLRRGENRSTLGAEKRTNNKLNPHMTPGPGIEPGTHWWEASAPTAPSLLPRFLHVSNSSRIFGGERSPLRHPCSLDFYMYLIVLEFLPPGNSPYCGHHVSHNAVVSSRSIGNKRQRATTLRDCW